MTCKMFWGWERQGRAWRTAWWRLSSAKDWWSTTLLTSGLLPGSNGRGEKEFYSSSLSFQSTEERTWTHAIGSGSSPFTSPSLFGSNNDTVGGKEYFVDFCFQYLVVFISPPQYLSTSRLIYTVCITLLDLLFVVILIGLGLTLFHVFGISWSPRRN